MAGIYDRLIPGNNRVGVHLLTASVLLAAEGIFTDLQVKNAINNQLDPTAPLDAAAETDMVNMKVELIAQPSIAAASRYVHRIESIGMALQSGEYANEAGFRSYLNID